GNIVRRMTGPPAQGFQRVNWDLRYAPPIVPAAPTGGGDEGGGGGGGGQFGGGPAGSLVLPGTYKVAMAKRVNGVITPLGTPQQFEVVTEAREGMSTADRVALVEF